jgi:hypothetical protein
MEPYNLTKEQGQVPYELFFNEDFENLIRLDHILCTAYKDGLAVIHDFLIN